LKILDGRDGRAGYDADRSGADPSAPPHASARPSGRAMVVLIASANARGHTIGRLRDAGGEVHVVRRPGDVRGAATEVLAAPRGIESGARRSSPPGSPDRRRKNGPK
jgi:hypothetical protein